MTPCGIIFATKWSSNGWFEAVIFQKRRVKFFLNFNMCTQSYNPTSVEKFTGIITYIQYVLVNAELQLIGPDDTRVVTHDSILAGLNCIYSTSSVTMTSLVVGDGPVAVEEAGSFSVELDMYTDESFSTKHTLVITSCFQWVLFGRKMYYYRTV